MRLKALEGIKGEVQGLQHYYIHTPMDSHNTFRHQVAVSVCDVPSFGADMKPVTR